MKLIQKLTNLVMASALQNQWALMNMFYVDDEATESRIN